MLIIDCDYHGPANCLRGYRKRQYWDVQRHALMGKYSGGLIRFRASPGRTCTVLTLNETESKLSRSGNLFGACAFGSL